MAVAHYLTQILHRSLREMPDRIATIDGDRRRTWHEVSQRARQFAGLMISLGLQGEDRVGLLAPNGDHYLEYLFGTVWAGGVINPVNLRWTAAEMAFSLADCDTGILIVHDSFAPLIDEIRRGAPCIRHVLVMGETATDWPRYEDALSSAASPDDTLRSGDDLAAILYTGGTTGKPKGVMLSHRSLMSSALGYAGTADCSPGECMLHTAPLFHIGAISGLLSSLLKRSRHVFLPGFEPGGVLAAIEKEKVTDLFLVPTMLQMVLDHPDFDPQKVASVERIIYGAAPMQPTLMDRALVAMPRCGFVQAYGMTELSPVVTLLSPADHLGDARDSGRSRSAGRATMTAEVRIVDADDNEVARGTRGEIVARGESVMNGYWNRPLETQEALRNGWMHTGDVGWMDEHGYVYVVDRLKDMIVTGGENVYSIEVEGALSSHPGVAQCAVVGLPHPKWGETVHAVVVLRDGWDADGDTLAEHCRQIIAGYKCPRSFEFRASLPLSGAGKILKAELRAVRP